jgi:hypothetical protein
MPALVSTLLDQATFGMLLESPALDISAQRFPYGILVSLIFHYAESAHGGFPDSAAALSKSPVPALCNQWMLPTEL